MRTIRLSTTDRFFGDWSYDAESKTFTATEQYAPFDTAYELINPRSGESMIFEFAYSTGPEFDPKTEWVYKSVPHPSIKGNAGQLHDQCFYFRVVNDETITKARAGSYLQAKRQN